MSVYTVKMKFRSTVRLGAPGRDDQAARHSIASDQFFSWLSLGWLRLYGRNSYEDEVLSPFLAGSLPWKHSDLFPMVDRKLWLPAPRWKTEKDGGNGEVDKKSRTNWVDMESFLSALKAGAAPMDTSYGTPMRVTLLNNVRINRFTDNDPYYTAVVQGGGETKSTEFAGCLESADSTVVEKLATVLDFMTDEGFGGNRTSGLGTIDSAAITSASSQFQTLMQKGTKRFAILSACYPTERMLDDLDRSGAGTNQYSLTSRAGWIYGEDGRATAVRKLTSFLFETGSSFGFEPEGKLVDVGREGLPCYRYAIPFTVSG